MSAIVYPSSLPPPSAMPTTSAERRAMAARPFEARAFQRDRHAFQEIVFAPFTADEAAVFEDWGANHLYRWGAWFSATWALPAGFVAGVRRFLAPPTRQYVAGGIWQYRARMELRGVGLPPVDDPTLPIWLWMRGVERGGDSTLLYDSSTNHRTVTPAGGAVVDPSVTDGPTGGCVDLVTGASARATTDPCPLFLGRWDIRVTIQTASIHAGTLPLLTQDADFDGGDTTPRYPLRLTATGSFEHVNFSVAGYANSNGSSFSIGSASIALADLGPWVEVKVVRSATDVRLYVDGALHATQPCVDGVGGAFYITPTLRGGLLIGDDGARTGGHTYAGVRLGEVYIDTQG